MTRLRLRTLAIIAAALVVAGLVVFWVITIPATVSAASLPA
jgi:uncharacterized membrane protein